MTRKKRHLTNRVYTQNIPDEVWAVWKNLKRVGDTLALCQRTGYSQPIITRALKRGHVFKQSLRDSISDYFSERADERLSQAEKRMLTIFENASNKE